MPMPWEKADVAPEASAPPLGTSGVQMPWEKAVVPEPPGLLSQAGTLLKESAKPIYEPVVEAGKQFLYHPGETAVGAGKALVGGALQLEELAASGLKGILSKASGGDFMPAYEQSMEYMQASRDAMQRITGVNLAPESKQEEAMANVLAIIPKAITAAGDDVFEKTGSALAGAGTQGLLTLLTFKPSLAAKALGGLKKVTLGDKASTASKAGGNTIAGAFDSLAPEEAAAIAEHIGKADETFGQALHKRIEELNTPEAAKAKLQKTLTKAGTDEEKLRALVSQVDKLEGKELEARVKELLPDAKRIFSEAKERGAGGMAVAPADLSEIMRGGRAPAGATHEQVLDNLHDTVKEGWELLGGRVSGAETLPSGPLPSTELPRQASRSGGQMLPAFDVGGPGRTETVPVDPRFGGRASGARGLTPRAAYAEAKRITEQREPFVEAPVEKLADPAVQRWVDKSQAGQIHPDLLTLGVSRLLRKMRSEDVVKMFAGTYNKERLIGLITAAQDPRSRETVVWMKPEDFRKFALPRSFDRTAASQEIKMHLTESDKQYYKDAAEAKRVSVREGLDTEKGLHDIPFLYIGQTKTPGLASIWGHEGRHRTDVFTEKGFELVPVRIVHKNMIEGERLSDIWPKKLQSENGAVTLDMPERAVYPPGEGPIETPFRYEDPIVYMNMGIPVTKAQIEKAFAPIHGFLSRTVPHYDAIVKEVSQSAEMAIRSAAPEMLGKDAKAAAAVLGKNQAVQMQAEVKQHHEAAVRRSFWNAQGATVALDFLKKYEKGGQFDNPLLNRAAEGYRALADRIFTADQAKGIKYDPRDNYMAHIFEDNEAAAEFFGQRFGPKWNDPSFTKNRGWDFIEEAIKPVSQGGGGLKLKYTNPEDIVLARQHASGIAHMRVDMLNDLEQYGMARKAVKGESPGPQETEYRSPNGQRFWVKGDARQIVHNAFNTKSWWEAKGIGGAAFRGAMGLKNTIVPLMLNLSLFHPVHVLFGMYNGSIMARIAKEGLGGERSTASTFAGILKAQAFTDLPKDWKLGSRIYDAYQGKVTDAQLTQSDRIALQYMNEGGLVPMIQSHFKMQSIERMRDALDQGHVVKAAFHTPFALVQALQRPTMEVMVPRLKVASYLRDVQTALKVDPTLADNPLRRMEAFRKIMKQTENRFGEMAYSQRFWNKTVKDIGVSTSLSMGWTLGFLDEFGAGPLRAAKSLSETKSLKASAVKGDLDQALFVGAYVTTAMMTAAVITYAMTGQAPEGMDYVLPRTGGTNPDGTPERMNTPFYTREFVSIGKHVQEKGALSGVGQYFANKAAPTIGLAWEWFVTNQNYFGQELSDPESDVFTRQAQKVASLYKDIEPISIRQLEQRGGGTAAQWGRSLAGFGPAPSYATTTPAVSYIKDTFRRTAGHMTPYEQVPYSEDTRKLRSSYLSGDTEAYNAQLEKMQDKYPELTAKKIRALERGLNVEPEVKMFKRLKPFQQKRALDKMTTEERDKFLPHANKELRYTYEPGAEE